MAVSLDHVSLAVDLFGKRALHDFCRPGTQPHARAFIAHTTLLLEQRDDWFPGVLVELGAVCVLNAADISRKLNRRYLHAKAKTEIRHLVFASELRRPDFPLDAALAESTRN